MMATFPLLAAEITINGFYTNWATFIANGDIGGETSSIGFVNQFKLFGFLANVFTMQVDRTAGSTNTVAVALQGSYNSVDWTTIVSITDVTAGFNDVNSSDDGARFNYKYIRILVTTIGSGNNLIVHVAGTF